MKRSEDFGIDREGSTARTEASTLTVGSLFSGIGGLELGLERAGMRVVWQVEKDEYCRRVLAKHWPNVTRFEDVKDVGKKNLAPVDVVCGGFPCQDVSHAGRREGIGGSRSGLWSEYARIIRDLRPRWVVVENVSGLLDRGFDAVLGSLAVLGYDAEWSVLSACAVGAPHTRERVFVVAYPTSVRQRQLRRGERSPVSAAQRHLHWPTNEPPCERVVDGVPLRLERLTALGNAVVPQVAELVGRWIVDAAVASERAA